MYNPEMFQQKQSSELYQLIRDFPLGTLLNVVGGEANATHIPFYLDTTGSDCARLRCHVARANPVWKQLAENSTALIVFQGPQSYVSPNWYPSKAQHGKAVPTWNYTAAHVRAKPTIVQDKDWLLSHITELSDAQESVQAKPWQVSDAPPAYIEKMCRMIVGLEFEITELEGKFKLSQNKSAEDKEGIIQGLQYEADKSATPASVMASMIQDQD